jgi:hypothetical protein
MSNLQVINVHSDNSATTIISDPVLKSVVVRIHFGNDTSGSKTVDLEEYFSTLTTAIILYQNNLSGESISYDNYILTIENESKITISGTEFKNTDLYLLVTGIPIDLPKEFLEKEKK